MTLPDIIEKIIDWIFTLVVLLQAIHILNNVLITWLKKLFTKEDKLEKTTINAIRIFVKITLRIIGGIFLLSNLGIEVSPLLASLGIGGIAIAFAAQSMLQDLFSSFSIIMSKTFKVGDYIRLNDEHSGIVSNINLKATHITAINWHEIRVPNKNVLSNEIENYSNMPHRRVRFDIWVEYHTSIKKLKEIPQIIEKIIQKHKKDIDFERTKMTKLWEYNINFKVSYLIHKPDYIVLSKQKSRNTQRHPWNIRKKTNKHRIPYTNNTHVCRKQDNKKKLETTEGIKLLV